MAVDRWWESLGFQLKKVTVNTAMPDASIKDLCRLSLIHDHNFGDQHLTYFVNIHMILNRNEERSLEEVELFIGL